MLHGITSRPLPSCLLSRHYLRPLKENDDTAIEGREGTSIPGGGGDDASDSDDDVEVT